MDTIRTVYLDSANAKEQNGSYVYDLVGGISVPEGARVFVDNVTDRRQPRNLNASSYDFNYRLRAPILDPRYFGVDVTYRFR